MTNNDDITFDANSGISEEEQREILAKINSITEKNQQSLSSRDRKQRYKAKKSGGLFPILVNVAAIAALAGGFYALSVFQGKTDANVREGNRVYNSAERILIEEIRRETLSRLELKENEITLVSSKLDNVDKELKALYSNTGELSADQLAFEARLKSLQEEYRFALAQLHIERSQILEEARTREASLQAQLENRTRELATVSEQSAAELNTARGEMERLSREQAQTAAIEAQMSAFFATLNRQIAGNHLDDASATVQAMREFLNTPSFLSLRSIQARRELYAQSINSFETMIAEAKKNHAALSSGVMPVDRETEQALVDLREKNARLEQDIAEKDQTLEALQSQGTGTTQRITELEGSLRTLRNTNSTLEANLARQTQNAETSRQTAANLQAENATLNQTITTRNNTISNQQATIANREQFVTTIEGVVEGKAITDMTLGELNDSLTRIQAALRAVNR